ncbi:MAG: thiamine-monophosphate kinase [Planctomycetes bacterium]|nr:thiamine-monophosphate kinase [Planctomycetota bacterium]
MTWSEDSIHRWLARGKTPRGLFGSRGHDAAVLRELGGKPVVCADQVVEGVHFLPSAPPRLVGRKVALRALSDLAPTAALPRALLCTAAVSMRRDERWLRAVLAGVRSAAREHGADHVGGDLSITRGRAVIAVTALGAFLGRGRPPGRDRARAGQSLVLTGPVGGSLLGRHLRIVPRLAEGRALFERGATAMMDVSDGLAWDLFRLARASKVAIELDLGAIPIHADARRRARASGRSALDHALHDGEDHELVALLAPRAARASGCAVVGRVARGTGLVLVHADGRRERWTHARGGFEHGR